LIVGFLLTVSFAPSTAMAWVDQQEPYADMTAGFNLAVGGGSEQKLAQVVTTGASGYLRSVKLPIGCGSDLLVEIVGVTDGAPNSTVLTSELFPSASMSPIVDGSWVEITFSTPVYLTVGTSFAIAVSVPDVPSGSCGYVPGPESSPYSGGDGFYDSRPNAPGWIRLLYNPGEPFRPDLPFQTIMTLTDTEPIGDGPPPTFTITATAGQHGSIVCTPQNDIPLGTTSVCEITADNESNFFVDYVTVDGEVIDAYSYAFTFTFEDIAEDHTISVTFDNIERGGKKPVAKKAARKVKAVIKNASYFADPEKKIEMIIPDVKDDGFLMVEKMADTTPLAGFKAVSDDSSKLEFSGTFEGEVLVCKKYNPEKVTKESDLKIMHYSNGLWEDITEYVDTEKKMVCGKTSSFSEFVVAEPLALPGPAAAFSWSADAITSFKINFSASGCPIGDTCTYSWDFGQAGGTTTGETTATPSHTYTDAIAKTITLVITDTTTGGISKPYSKSVLPVSRNIAPVASRTITQSGWAVTVVDSSTDDATLSAGAVYIDWGNGTSSTGNAGDTFTKTYTVAGNYVIKHKVKDAAGVATWSANASVYVPVKYSVSGKVTRSNGTTAISGTTLYLRKTGTTTKTNAAASRTNGTYTFSGVAPGTYDVIAIKAGYTFASPALSGVVVNPANVTGIDISSVAP
jgi:PKD repeat protein